MILAFVVMALAVALVITLAMLSSKSPSDYSEYLKDPEPMWSVTPLTEQERLEVLRKALDGAKETVRRECNLQIPPERDE